MIGNGHLDVAWLWQVWEGLQEVKATFRSALDRMDEYPDFQFAASSSAYYEWIEQNEPAMFEEIRRRVAEGRWHLVGGWWVEPDCNLPGGEALVRQALLGQRYLLSRFGRIASIGYNIDTFGHPGSLPQLLSKSGVDAYVFMRPGSHEKGLPERLFWWEGDDGSRVLAYRLPYEYCTPGGDIAAHVDRCAAELHEPFATGMCFYGVGNHGGGPTKANIEAIQRLAAERDDVELQFSSPEAFFAEMKRASLPLPTVHDELQHHAPGCYSAHSGVKSWNRRAEQLLLQAEKFSTLAAGVTGSGYPGADFERAWKSLLFNQFHDVLAGTSIEPAMEDARHAYSEAIAIASRSLNHALQALAWRIDIPRHDSSPPLIVFNPHAWPSRVNVELESDGLGGATGVVDESGSELPLQTVTSLATVGKGRRRVSFSAELPALGYRVFRARAGVEPPVVSAPAGDHRLESRRWRLEFDPATGCLSSIWDKVEECEALAAPARAVVIEDASDTWSHDVTRFQDEAGSFQLESLELVEHGPVKSTLRATSRFGASRLRQDFTVFEDLDLIEVRVVLDWRERHRLLKLRFPINVRFHRATYEVPYGRIERPADGEEEPGQTWIDVSGVHRVTNRLYGLSLVNDAKYSYDVRGREMSVTVVRSPVYAHHDPHRPEDWEGLHFMDQGEQRFTYALVPHAGGWEDAGTVQRAAELNQRAVVLVDTWHRGTLPGTHSLAEAGPANVVLSALKAAEDGEGAIVRCHETAGRATRAWLRLAAWNRTLDFDLGAHEIKTFRVPREAGQPVLETDLLERPTGLPAIPAPEASWTPDQARRY